MGQTPRFRKIGSLFTRVPPSNRHGQYIFLYLQPYDDRDYTLSTFPFQGGWSGQPTKKKIVGSAAYLWHGSCGTILSSLISCLIAAVILQVLSNHYPWNLYPGQRNESFCSCPTDPSFHERKSLCQGSSLKNQVFVNSLCVYNLSSDNCNKGFTLVDQATTKTTISASPAWVWQGLWDRFPFLKRRYPLMSYLLPLHWKLCLSPSSSQPRTPDGTITMPPLELSPLSKSTF